eukprot:CAMPEP_0185587068 /NCGR_PEP_ID=MMETSP0434-20130131/47376_1 /TAXON_ID=626734 ORGANISM="Favella taraikaensis, Strain Fe Narragansett Bay" /NCGR_SAMPLE_ID=MMETSP0434 /ASSEMBLY_ACC=CAM_ASM_000379 /LENGTH=86 /DNA_ID=CAMNT_0028208671 /DNA_START=668 /DNA_END=929 /DNA_ORIENTATION=-
MKAINECDSGDESNYEVAGMGSDQENEFPEACMICEGNFTEPVVTNAVTISVRDALYATTPPTPIALAVDRPLMEYSITQETLSSI